MEVDNEFLNLLRKRLPISRVVGQHFRLMQTGGEYQATCPFHRNFEQSLVVSDSYGFFHCSVCETHGDIVGFTIRFSHMTYAEAVVDLAILAGFQPSLPMTPERIH